MARVPRSIAELSPPLPGSPARVAGERRAGAIGWRAPFGSGQLELTGSPDGLSWTLTDGRITVEFDGTGVIHEARFRAGTSIGHELPMPHVCSLWRSARRACSPTSHQPGSPGILPEAPEPPPEAP